MHIPQLLQQCTGQAANLMHAIPLLQVLHPLQRCQKHCEAAHHHILVGVCSGWRRCSCLGCRYWSSFAVQAAEGLGLHHVSAANEGDHHSAGSTTGTSQYAHVCWCSKSTDQG